MLTISSIFSKIFGRLKIWGTADENDDDNHLGQRNFINLRFISKYDYCEELFGVDLPDEPVVNWDRLFLQYDRQLERKMVDLQPVLKDFYREAAQVNRMSSQDAAQWRRENNFIDIKRTFGSRPALRNIPNPVLTFEQAFFQYPQIVAELYKQGFQRPLPIQSQAWPIILRGEDFIGQNAPGKVLAFVLPAVIHVNGQITPREFRVGPSVLVITPTKERAWRIEKEFTKYLFTSTRSTWLGGGVLDVQTKINNKALDILVATPGRLHDLVLARRLIIINVSYIVLDQVDIMLNMGFKPQLKKAFYNIRPERQIVVTSDTWPPSIQGLVKCIMRDPIQIDIVTPNRAPVHRVVHKLQYMEESEKDDAIFHFIKKMKRCHRVLIICRKNESVQRIAHELDLMGIESKSVLSDGAGRDRETEETCHIVIVAEEVSRDMDIFNMTHVVNMDFPRHADDYMFRVHSLARTAKSGVILTFFTTDELIYSRDLVEIIEEVNRENPDDLEIIGQRFEHHGIRDVDVHRGRRSTPRGSRGRGLRWQFY